MSNARSVARRCARDQSPYPPHRVSSTGVHPVSTRPTKVSATASRSTASTKPAPSAAKAGSSSSARTKATPKPTAKSTVKSAVKSSTPKAPSAKPAPTKVSSTKVPAAKGAPAKAAAKPAAKTAVKAAAAKPASKPAAVPAATKPTPKPAVKPAEAKPTPKPAVKVEAPAKSAPRVSPVTVAEVEAVAAAAELVTTAVVAATDTATAIASLLPTPPRRSDVDDSDDRYRPSVGTVALAAAGPGDTDLVSVRTAALLDSADVVLADMSALPVAERFAGKRAEVRALVDADGLPLDPAARVKQAVDVARTGRDVVRLLGGDPTTDSGWAAEAALLSKAKVPFEMSPAVSLITGVTSHAGIPLTGGRSREVRIVDADDTAVSWADHVDGRISLVVLNGADRAVDIARSLMSAGRRDDTPVAITRDGTTVEQRTITATLGELHMVVKASRQVGPGVMVVGEPVSRRAALSWFETKPLFGWRVLVPRTKASHPGLAAHLRRFGAVSVEVPTISVEPPRTPQQMERAVHGLVSGRYQWIVFTSANAVRALREKFEEYGLDSRAYSGLRIAAVGADTADALEQFGVRPDLMPSSEQSTAALVDEFPEFDDVLDPINRVFLPRADIATEGLVAGLTELGWEVDDVTAYRTVRAAPPPAETREAIKSGGFDAVLFTSASAVRNLVGIAGKPHHTTVVACIGPQTAKAAEEHGLRVDVLSETSNVFALVESLAEHGEKLRLAALDAGELTWRPSRRRGGARRRTT